MNEALDLFYGLVLEDGRRIGEAAADFQREDAEAVLEQNSSAPNHFITRPRGDSKTSDLAGHNIAVGLAQAPQRARMYALAADEKQGRLLVDAMAGFVSRTPELQNALVIRESSVHFRRSDARLEVLAADQASIWGLRLYFVTVDEIGQWHSTAPPQRCWEAVSTAATKVPGSRLVVLTTAGDPAHWSKGVRDHALADALWKVHEVPGPPHWLDPIRLEGERRRLPESSYLRLFMNEWTSSEDRLASEDDLLACVTLDGPLDPKSNRRYVIGLDVGLKHDATVAAVCHAEKVPGAEHPEDRSRPDGPLEGLSSSTRPALRCRGVGRRGRPPLPGSRSVRSVPGGPSVAALEETWDQRPGVHVLCRVCWEARDDVAAAHPRALTRASRRPRASRRVTERPTEGVEPRRLSTRPRPPPSRRPSSRTRTPPPRCSPNEARRVEHERGAASSTDGRTFSRSTSGRRSMRRSGSGASGWCAADAEMGPHTDSRTRGEGEGHEVGGAGAGACLQTSGAGSGESAPPTVLRARRTYRR